jgi:hypothetical protein
MRSLIAFVAAGLILAIAGTAGAVSLYVDSAPNVSGSPAWGPWWTQTKADVVGGVFTNMRTGTYPGTTTMSPYDEIVYSTGDLGKRLHWIYWVPDTNIATLAAANFQVKWVIDWGGDAWTYDWNTNDWAVDSADAGWVQPSSWENYNGGVIGSFGFAWWATDNDALPLSTHGNLYDETDAADIAANAQADLLYQTYALGEVRYQSPTGEWVVQTLNVSMVPEPITMAGLMLGIGGLVGYVRRRTRK